MCQMSLLMEFSALTLIRLSSGFHSAEALFKEPRN